MKHLFKKSLIGIFFSFVYIIISFSIPTSHIEAATVSAKADGVNPLTISGSKSVALVADIDFAASECRLYKGADLTTPIETKTAAYGAGSTVSFTNQTVTATTTFTVKCDEETYTWSSGVWGTCTSSGTGTCSGSYTTVTGGYCGGTVLDKSTGDNSCTRIFNQRTCDGSPPCYWVNTTSTVSCVGPTTSSACTSQNTACTFTPSTSGSQTRTVVCVNSSGVTVADSFCPIPKPTTTQSCTL